VTTAIFSVTISPVFDERDIREGLGGGSGHVMMKTPNQTGAYHYAFSRQWKDPNALSHRI